MIHIWRRLLSLFQKRSAPRDWGRWRRNRRSTGPRVTHGLVGRQNEDGTYDVIPANMQRGKGPWVNCRTNEPIDQPWAREDNQ